MECGIFKGLHHAFRFSDTEGAEDPGLQEERPRLASKLRHQDPHGPLAHGIRLQGRERTGITVDEIGRAHV